MECAFVLALVGGALIRSRVALNVTYLTFKTLDKSFVWETFLLPTEFFSLLLACSHITNAMFVAGFDEKCLN